MYLTGYVNEKKERVDSGIAIPGFLSFLIHGDFEKPVTGLKSFEPKDRPPANFVFQLYHSMVAIGMALIALSLWGTYLWSRGKLFDSKWTLRLFVIAVLGPQIANQVGWFAAEVGRQPWIVYGLLRTSEGLSKSVKAHMVLSSLIMFAVIYLLLFVLFVYLLDQKIKHGPEEEIHTTGPALPAGRRAEV